jgi:hypothetical protein
MVKSVTALLFQTWLCLAIPVTAQEVDWKKCAEAETTAFQKGDYAEAAQLLQSFLKAAEKLHGPDAKEVVPALIKLIHVPTSMNRRYSAINILGKIGPDARGAVPVLIDLLGDDNVLPEESSRLSPTDQKQNARVLRGQVAFALRHLSQRIRAKPPCSRPQARNSPTERATTGRKGPEFGSKRSS